MKRYLISGGVAAVLLLGGCSNVHVRKVSVEDRTSGRDRDVKGFRYYLTRPYVLVKFKVPVGCEATAAELATVAPTADRPGKYVLISVRPDPKTGSRRYFEMNGDENPAIEKLNPAPVGKVKPPVKPPDKPNQDGLVTLTAAAPVNPINPAPGTQFPVGPVGALGARATTDGSSDGSNFPFDVVDLPDFEEQYAIHNVNILAHTQYGYQFVDGCKLGMASGSYNSTEIPVAILNTIGNLISAIGNVRSTALGGGGGGGAAAVIDTSDTSVYYVLHQSYIEPGLYRIQKSWERVAAAAAPGLEPDRCVGLLTELGLAVHTCTTVLSSTEYDNLLSGTPNPGAGGGPPGTSATPGQ